MLRMFVKIFANAGSHGKTKVGVDIPITTTSTVGGQTVTTTIYKRYWFQEVKSTPEIGEAPNTIDVTHLGSDIHEYILDIPDQASSTLLFTMNAQPYDTVTTSTDGDKASNLGLVQMMSKTADYDFIILYPQDKIGFKQRAQWTWSMGAGSVSSAMELNLTLIPRGTPIPIYLTSTKYTVSYDANGGTGSVTDSTEYSAGDEVTVKASTGLTAPTNSVFASWNTKADGTGVSYDATDTFSIFEDTTLYAIWITEE